MFIQSVSQPVITQGILRTAQATIKANRKVFNMFADDIYSNKPLAICRELVSNAIDSHTEAGISNVPVEVWLPTEFDPMFRVKDQGIGMSEDFVFSSYLTYADGSTKDGTNEQIGGFGIGKASVFSYIDQFTLRSVHQGTLSVYTVYISEEGIPTVGLLSQCPTSEANGVEVNFPVELDDHDKFHAAAQQGLAHFNPIPKVYGGEVTAPEYISQGTGWGMRPSYGDLNVVMGGVCYPVRTSNLDLDLCYDDEISDLLNFGLDITLPIGSCGVALSREALSYDEKTSKVIAEALRSLKSEIAASFATMFDGYETRWEAVEALNIEIGGGASGRAKFLSDQAVWKGDPLETGFCVPGSAWIIETPRTRRGKISEALTVKWVWSLKNHVRPTAYEQIIIDDLPTSSASKTGVRLKHFARTCLERRKPSIVLRPNGTLEDFIHELGDIPRNRYLLTSELEVPAPERRVKKGERPRVRMFTYDGSTTNNFGRAADNIHPSRRGVYEIPYEHQPLEGVLVVMENFNLPADLQKAISCDLLKWSELRFVNRGDAHKLRAADWPLYSEVLNQRLQQVLASAQDLPARLAVSADRDLRPMFNLIRSLGPLELTKAQRSRPFGKLVALFQQYVEPLTTEQCKVAPYISAVLPSKIQPEKLVGSFKTKQPYAARLAALNHNSVTYDREFFLELI